MNTLTVVPSGYDATRTAWYSANNIQNGYADTTNTTPAYIYLTRGGMAETYIYYTFDVSAIPLNATINSVTGKVKCLISETTSSRITQRNIQLFSGSTAKGNATTIDNMTSLFDLTPGNWTREELENISLRVYAQRGYTGSNNNYYIVFNGAEITIEYEAGGATQTLKIKSNGSWTEVSKVYKKENGSWVEQADLSQVFDTNANYARVN